MRQGTFRISGLAAWLAVAVGLTTPLISRGEGVAASQPQATETLAVPKNIPPKNIPPKKPALKKSKKKPRPEQQLPPPPPPSEEPLAEIIGVVDAPRDYLAEKFIGFVNSVDRFFGDDRNFQESHDSVLQFDITRVMGYGGERQFVYSGRAKVRLPNTEKKLHLLIETDPDKNVSTDSSRNQPMRPGTRSAPESYGAGVRYEKEKEERWHYSTEGGLKFQGVNTAPFARARVSYGVPLEEWRLKATETVFWFNSIGAGETTQLDLDRPISEPLLFRATSIATWLKDSENLDMRQDFSLFHKLNNRAAVLYQASVIGISRPNAHVTDYVLLLSYRYRVHREWVFFELSPQLHFPKERHFKSSGMLGMRLEMLLDGSK
ncbi:MAG: hypothetical protein HZB95_00775 [Nitrosomonadales bacterium]|nr:hypothetical protein [Nitrosomonadales bacterium]